MSKLKLFILIGVIGLSPMAFSFSLEEQLFQIIKNESSFKNRNKLKELIKQGVDVNTTDSYGYTALYYAIRYYKDSYFSILVENGADIYALGHLGNTALHYATTHINVTASKYLISAGVNVNAKNTYGETPLENLLSGFKKFNKRAIQLKRHLIKAGADLNIKNDRGTPLLIKTIMAKNKNATLELIEAGADLNIRDANNQTALMLAFKHGEYDLARILIEKGADIYLTDTYGDTVLHIAVVAISKNKNFHKFLPVIKLLFEKGIDVNVRNYFAQTPLHKLILLVEVDYKMLNFLVSAGADVNAIVADHTALDFIIHRNNISHFTIYNKNQVSHFLDAKNFKPNRLFNSSNKVIYDFLISNGATPHKRIDPEIKDLRVYIEMAEEKIRKNHSKKDSCPEAFR